ncbi:bifunctional hydroxymethylpyrimidine kinase/phosphomethylpyrimidine kinase [Oceanobacillus sp. CFH 90083]|uniref:bifunctional hydroxymethylpyrimidine kinase/phosphomethylpyrimidine kinase n=1 Tax=Oceanobacillus sp. CFH 90083 TaxID=2592336 RepID=UPI00128B3295|nr:bifunctional hydroxymethylpyrimidine kinase/phosphomethylpyrimidine kinase [Oceanobacillus sp. CFH 90083]
MSQVRCTLTIAGTDPSGGAGIQADLKTFQELQTYGMSVITSVVAQNTTGVRSVEHMPLSILKDQLEAVIEDMPIHAVKTGMIASKPMMELIAAKLKQLDAPYVMDPVMIATSGDALINEEARSFLRQCLLPLTTVVTPNIPEAEFLTGLPITSTDDMKGAAEYLVHEYGVDAALVKGGHLKGQAIDFLYDGRRMHSYSAERIDTENTHGTGCTYAAAIAAYLSKDYPLPEAVKHAKAFVTAAISNSFALGAGHGPTNHWAIRENAGRKITHES